MKYIPFSVRTWEQQRYFVREISIWQKWVTDKKVLLKKIRNHHWVLNKCFQWFFTITKNDVKYSSSSENNVEVLNLANLNIIWFIV